jgi:hypothetical protein
MHQNNFMNLVNAQEVIEIEQNMIKNAKANNKAIHKTTMEVIQNRLMGISQCIQDRKLQSCPFETQACKADHAKVINEIFEPFPTVLTLNINWFNNQVPYTDTLLFCSSIPSKFHLNNLYTVGTQTSDKSQVEEPNPEYILKSVVCFLGAHYMTYIKKTNIFGKKVWKLYDDDKHIKEYKSWN